MKKPAIYEMQNNHIDNIKDFYGIKEDEYLYYCDNINSRNDLRPELDRLKKDIKDGKVSYVKVISIAQISRNPHIFCDFIKYVEDNGCKIIDRDGFDNHILWHELIEEGKIEYLDIELEDIKNTSKRIHKEIRNKLNKENN